MTINQGDWKMIVRDHPELIAELQAEDPDECIRALEAKLRKTALELEFRKGYMDALPFCPDHRDKVKGKPCRECEIESLTRKLRNAQRTNRRLQQRLDEAELAEDDNWLLEDEYE